MIKNAGCGVLLALLWACDGARAAEPERYQGVVEHGERVLGFEVGGRLSSVAVRRGSTIEGGAAIAALDDTLERLAREARAAEARAAEAQLDLVREGPREEETRAARAELAATRSTESLLRRNLERTERLHAGGATADVALDEVRAQLDQAVARRQAAAQKLSALRDGSRSQEVEAAEARAAAAAAAVKALDERLERYRLEAPAAGTVIDVHVEPGEVVAPGAPVVTMADLDRPYVDVFVPQQDVGGIRVGAAAEVRVDSFEEPFRGEVEDVASRTEFTPRFLFSERERPNLVIRVRIRVEDPDHALVAGVPAFAHIERGSGARGR